MAKQVIQSAQMNQPFTQAERDFIETVRNNPSMPEYVELYLAGIV
jgi:hypothetical protein